MAPIDQSDIDRPLLVTLMKRWVRRYEAAEPAWQDVALIRSLNMAYHASLLPAGTDTTFYDVTVVMILLQGTPSWHSMIVVAIHLRPPPATPACLNMRECPLRGALRSIHALAMMVLSNCPSTRARPQGQLWWSPLALCQLPGASRRRI